MVAAKFQLITKTQNYSVNTNLSPIYKYVPTTPHSSGWWKTSITALFSQEKARRVTVKQTRTYCQDMNSDGKSDNVSNLISGKVWSGKMILRCFSSSSFSFLAATVISGSSWSGKILLQYDRKWLMKKKKQKQEALNASVFSTVPEVLSFQRQA